MNAQATAAGPRKKFRILKWALWLLGGLIGLVAILVLVLVLSAPARQWAASRIVTDGILNGRLADVPVRTEAQPVQQLMVTMRDGIELSTQVYLPEGSGPWPVILVRDPYSFAQYNSCAVFVRYDYACVYQEVRGRGPSQGVWYPFIEREDGLDTLDWVLQQPWQDGHIALQGGSYLGVTQWAMAGDLPAEVKTFVATVSHGDIYQLAYRNGVFNQAVAGAWLHAQFRPWYRLITAAGRWREKVAGHYPAKGADPAEFGKTWQPYFDYISHPERDDPYWQSTEYVTMRKAHRKVSVPVMMIGSANDFFLPGMLPTFEELPAQARSVFMLGPGNHGGQAEDEVDGSYTNDYVDTLAWLDHHLKGAPLPDPLKPGFNVFIHGENVWRFYPNWPEPTATLEFQLDRLADAQACDGGALTTGSAAAGQQARFAYDPRNPVPTRGGAFVLLDSVAPAAVDEQGNDLCSRPDVLSFSSGPIADGALVNGGMTVKLRVASDAADTTFTVKVSEHFADGRVYNIRDDISSLGLRNGATRQIAYTPGEKVEIVFALTPIAWQLQPGSRLRLDISSSNWPAFFAHPNKAGLWSEVVDPVIANQTVFSGSLEIPIER